MHLSPVPLVPWKSHQPDHLITGKPASALRTRCKAFEPRHSKSPRLVESGTLRLHFLRLKLWRQELCRTTYVRCCGLNAFKLQSLFRDFFSGSPVSYICKLLLPRVGGTIVSDLFWPRNLGMSSVIQADVRERR